jgi:predicted phage terminase large subunit-like protein
MPDKEGGKSVLDGIPVEEEGFPLRGKGPHESVAQSKSVMFHARYFDQRVRAAPYHAKRILYVARASITLMCKDADGNYYVEHNIAGMWEQTERNEEIRGQAIRCRTRYGPHHEPIIYIEAEGSSSGRDTWKDIARKLAGFPVREDRVTGNKETRAEPWAAQLAAGNVYIVDNGESEGVGKSEWDIQAYVNEHVSFPINKDRVDSSSGAFNRLQVYCCKCTFE